MKAECKACRMSQPNDEAYSKSDFEWPIDYECELGGVYFPDHAHFCQHFIGKETKV